MSLSLLIIDRQPRFIEEVASTLPLPVGTGCLLESIISALGPALDGRVLVMRNELACSAREDAIRKGTHLPVTFVVPGRLGPVAGRFEEADTLLAVDVARWPLDSTVLQDVLRSGRDYHGATCMVALGSADDRIFEWVQCDTSGEVNGAGRSYGSVMWPGLAAVATVAIKLPAAAIGNIPFASLRELRGALSEGGTLCQDVPVSCDLLDLADEAGFLALHESMLAHAMDRAVPRGFRRPSASVLVGQHCRIHPGARLVGPVVLQNRCVIEEGATIVGPSVVGEASTIRSRVTLAQCVVERAACVRGGASPWRRVVSASETRGYEARDPRFAVAAVQHVPAAQPRRHARKPENRRSAEGSIRRWLHAGLKRLLDVVLSLLGLVATAPLLLVAAVLIKLDSRGPVLFTHYRERRGGKPFPCWKFRTMVQDAHRQQRELYRTNELDGPQFKMRDDPRVTWVGRWLRVTNIDEIPQLINVLLGHMSLVGPRPSPFRENQICVPWRRARLSVRPGITGLWQLCRDRRNDADFHQWIFFDLMYVRHFSIWLDVKILAATLLSLGGFRRVPVTWLIRDPYATDARPLSGVSREPLAAAV
jgi:lipopolysaccharide/colanic/teichoic acid biosynthesis glycosyltransferase